MVYRNKWPWTSSCLQVAFSLRAIIFLSFLMAWIFSSIYIFPWNSTPFPPIPRLRLHHQIRARHLLQSALTQNREGLGQCVRCLVRCWSVLSGCTHYRHCESSAKAYTELAPEPQLPVSFPAHRSSCSLQLSPLNLSCLDLWLPLHWWL